MCYCFNQDIYLTSDNKAYEMKRRRIRIYSWCDVFFIFMIGGVERGGSTGAGADDRSI